jgi:hypothetical protein
MRDGARGVQVFVSLLVVSLVACGGGTQPPPPQPSFTVTFSATSVTVSSQTLALTRSAVRKSNRGSRDVSGRIAQANCSSV